MPRESRDMNISDIKAFTALKTNIGKQASAFTSENGRLDRTIGIKFRAIFEQ